MEKTITVTELISIYRGALISLLPWMEKLGVLWKMHESYDDWDSISACMYYNILCASLYSEVASTYPVIRSVHNLKYLSTLDYVGIELSMESDKLFIFKDLESVERPLDTIIVLVVDSNGEFLEKRMLEYSDDFRFYFAKMESGQRQVIKTIQVGFA